MPRLLVIELSSLEVLQCTSEPSSVDLAMAAKVELEGSPSWEGPIRVSFPSGVVISGCDVGSHFVERDLLPGTCQGYIMYLTQWAGRSAVEPFPLGRAGPLWFRPFRYEFDVAGEHGAKLLSSGPL